MKSFGYTLAEVLITLGIIGVVAAITIPMLISKVQLKIFETAFKKEYSTLSNAINYITTTEQLSECYTYLNVISFDKIQSDCTKLYQNLIKNLDLKPADPNMYNLYAKRDDVLANGGRSIHKGILYDYYMRISTPYLLKDGSILFIPGGEHMAQIVFDVNGKKGPNKWGYDVFWMELSRPANNPSGNTRLTDEYASLKEKGGRYPREILRGQPGLDENQPYNW